MHPRRFLRRKGPLLPRRRFNHARITMIAKPRRLMFRMSQIIEIIVLLLAFAMRDVRERFRPRPRPNDAPLVSGIAPAEEGNTRPLSETQLEQLHCWFRQHQEGWTRFACPPYFPNYLVRVEHSDGTIMDVLFFTKIRPEVRFRKLRDGRSDGGWLSVPRAEVERLIALLSDKG